MELFFAFIIKLTIIFIGSGVATLLAYWIVQETSTITRLFFYYQKINNKKEKLVLAQQEKINFNSGLYEIKLPAGKIIKVLSSLKGMKVIA